VRNVSLLIAIGVGTDGFRTILDVAEGHKEDKSGWSGLLRHLKERGLKGVRVAISDACLGLKESQIETGPACGGAMRIIACIEDPDVIEKILTHLDTKAAEPRAPMRPPGRAPP
jgi:hypothetical protein